MNRIDTCANRIKIRLEELDMTQADLVKATGINKATISQYISGKYMPKHDRIELLAKALNVGVVWLMGYDVPKGSYHKMEMHFVENVKVPQIDKEAIARESKLLSAFIKAYDQLNEDGRIKLIEYAEDLVASGRYIKSDNVSKEA